MNREIPPELKTEEELYHFNIAGASDRKRSALILHKPGDYLNKVFNFILEDSYMRPHIHPSEEKDEKMHLIKGSFALIMFDNKGNVTESILLEKGNREYISVPAFVWHTYVMFSKEVIVYETMEGVYDPDTWKKMAPWAPKENTLDAVPYLEMLKTRARS